MSNFGTVSVKDSSNVVISPSTQDTLKDIKSAVNALASAKGAVADLRVTLLSGVVTTVTTVTGLTNIGGFSANTIVRDIGNVNVILTNLNNISRS